MMPNLSDMEQWLESQWPDKLRELPQQVSDKAHEYYTILYQELSRYGPPDLQMSDITNGVKEGLHSLQEKVLPSTVTPPPPPPSPPGTIGAAFNWARDHPIAVVTGATATSVGLGLAYARVYPDSAKAVLNKVRGTSFPVRREARVRNGIRREAVVVLGADTPLGRALLLDLTSQGLIVIAAVSNTTSLKSFDTQLLPSSRGYVAVRHFDLNALPDSVDGFVAEIKSTLALRFPLNAPGDPFARPGDGAILIGIINALSYVSASESTVTDQLSNVATTTASAGASLQRALSIHVTAPVSAISSLLPELRLGPQRIYTQNPEYLTPLTVITLVDGGAARADSATVAHLVAESAASAAHTLRQSASVQTVAQASTPGPNRPIRFTVLSVPSAPPKDTWTNKEMLTSRVTNKVSDLVLASDSNRRLQLVTHVTLPGPSISLLFTPVLQALHRAHLSLVRVLPQPVVQRLEALYRIASNVSRRIQVNVLNLSGSRRHRRTTPGSEPRRSSNNNTLIRRISAGDGVSGYDLNRGATPRPSSAELDAPSTAETGSSADDDEVLRSAPSSSLDEDEDRFGPSSQPNVSVPESVQSMDTSNPWSTSQVETAPEEVEVSRGSTPDASQHLGSSTASTQSAQSSQPAGRQHLDQSWVRLGESALRDSQHEQ